jgi:hypothetical protein
MMTIIVLDAAGPLAPAGAIGLIQSPRRGSSQTGSGRYVTVLTSESPFTV